MISMPFSFSYFPRNEYINWRCRSSKVLSSKKMTPLFYSKFLRFVTIESQIWIKKWGLFFCYLAPLSSDPFNYKIFLPILYYHHSCENRNYKKNKLFEQTYNLDSEFFLNNYIWWSTIIINKYFKLLLN